MKYLSCALLLALLPIAGCMSESAPDTKAPMNFSVTDTPAYDFAVSPPGLIEKVKQTLATMGIAVDDQQGSALITAYKSYPGSFHIVRRWQERTRYRITISPDSYEPTRRAHLEITSQTQTRATDQEPWHTWAEYQRPQRAALLAKMLHEQIASAASSSPPMVSEPVLPARPAPADAETVLVTYHVMAGKESELQQDLSQAWESYQKDNLVISKPHVLVRQKDAAGQISFVEIFSWASHQAPEHVSDAAKKLWDQEQACCQPRDGRPGIDIIEVDFVSPQK